MRNNSTLSPATKRQSPFLKLPLLWPLVAFALLGGAATASAVTKTWVPAAGGVWTTAANWSPNGAPAAGDSVTINSDQSASITAVPAITLSNLTINGNCLFAAATSGNTLTINNSFNVSASKTFTMGAPGSRIVFTLAGTGTVNGNVAYDAGTTVRNFTVSGTLIVNPGGRVYDPILSPGSVFILTSGATLKIGNPGGISTVTTANTNVAINFGGSYSYGTGANYYYIGNSNQVTGNGLPATINSLTISNTGSVGNNTVALSTNVAVSGNLTVSAGTLDLAAYTANRGTAGGTFTLGNGTSLLVGANNFPTTYGSFSLGATSTVSYYGAGAQNVSAKSYGNLIFSGSGSKNLVAGTSVGGNLSIAPAGAAIASVGAGLNLPVGSLILGGLGRTSGTWGSSSSSATYQNNTYFAGTTGFLTVSTETRSTPTISTLPTASGTITYGQTLATVVLSGGSASVPGTFAFTTPSTAPSVGSYSASITFTPTDTTSYTTVVSSLNVNVAPKTLTPTVTLNNKVYDGTTAPTTIASRSLIGIVGSDDVTLGASGTVAAFSSRNVGNSTPSVSGLSLSGSTAGNYVLSTTAVSPGASIQARPLTVTAHANSRIYDGGTSATTLPDITSGSLQTGDAANFTEAYGVKDVGTGKTLIPAGTVSDGNGGNNYAVTFLSNASGVITARGLTVTGITAGNKPYDGNTTATLNTAGEALVGKVAGDVVTPDSTGAVGAFIDAQVGTGKTVLVSGLSISGADKDNYTLSQPSTTANITMASSATALGTSSNPLVEGSNVTFTATITAASTATTTPTGTVEFFVNGTSLGAPINLAAGLASISTTQLPRGSNYITVNYSGDANFLSSSNGLAEQVNPAPGLLSIQYHPDYTTTLTLQGVAGAQYLFQATSDLGSGAWTVISTNTAGFDGLSIYNDLDAPNYAVRFYRAVTP